MTPEGQVQRQILNYLSKLEKQGLPVFYEKRQAGGFSYKHGIPDIYGIYNGLHFEVEVKAPDGERRADQEKWQERFEKINVKYCCVDSIKAFQQWFNETFITKSY